MTDILILSEQARKDIMTRLAHKRAERNDFAPECDRCQDAPGTKVLGIANYCADCYAAVIEENRAICAEAQKPRRVYTEGTRTVYDMRGSAPLRELHNARKLLVIGRRQYQEATTHEQRVNAEATMQQAEITLAHLEVIGALETRPDADAIISEAAKNGWATRRMNESRESAIVRGGHNGRAARVHAGDPEKAAKYTPKVDITGMELLI